MTVKSTKKGYIFVSWVIVTRQFTKDAENALFYGEAYCLPECSVNLRVLTPQQIAKLCRPDRPSRTRPRIIPVSNEINVESIDHESMFLIFILKII